MSRERYRVWQFLHPDLDLPAGTPQRGVQPVGPSLAPPMGLQLSPTGGAAMVTEQAAVRQGLLLLLSTRPGERVMRPGYGCDLQRLLFSPNDETTAGLAIYYVRQAIERWEPRVHILSLDANANGDRPQQLDIFLAYELRFPWKAPPSQAAPPETLAFAINLEGA